MKCPNCGAESSDNMKFCMSCGSPLPSVQDAGFMQPDLNAAAPVQPQPVSPAPAAPTPVQPSPASPAPASLQGGQNPVGKIMCIVCAALGLLAFIFEIIYLIWSIAQRHSWPQLVTGFFYLIALALFVVCALFAARKSYRAMLVPIILYFITSFINIVINLIFNWGRHINKSALRSTLTANLPTFLLTVFFVLALLLLAVARRVFAGLAAAATVWHLVAYISSLKNMRGAPPVYTMTVWSGILLSLALLVLAAALLIAPADFTEMKRKAASPFAGPGYVPNAGMARGPQAYPQQMYGRAPYGPQAYAPQGQPYGQRAYMPQGQPYAQPPYGQPGQPYPQQPYAQPGQPFAQPYAQQAQPYAQPAQPYPQQPYAPQDASYAQQPYTPVYPQDQTPAE